MKQLIELTLTIFVLSQPVWCQPRIDVLVSSSDLISPALGAGSLATAFCRGFQNFPSLVVGSGNPIPTNLAGVSVTVNGRAAPLLAVAGSATGIQQVNFQVPWEVASTFERFEIVMLNVAISFGGQSATRVQQAAISPGEFFWIGKNPAIFHADYSLVTGANPAKWGETLIAYANGLSITFPRVQTGFSAPMEEPLARLLANRGYSLSLRQERDPFYFSPTVLYQGLAPGLVGVFQINFVLDDRYLRSDTRNPGEGLLEIIRDCGLFRCPPRTASFSMKIPIPISGAVE